MKTTKTSRITLRITPAEVKALRAWCKAHKIKSEGAAVRMALSKAGVTR